MKKLAVLVAFLVGVLVGSVADHRARAQSYIQDTSAAPVISVTTVALAKFWSQQALARGVATDAQWSSSMATLFAAANSPGMDPTALTFLRTFFQQIVHVGVP
jgi:O-methyltransferase involved in polyketide biosynthesis